MISATDHLPTLTDSAGDAPVRARRPVLGSITALLAILLTSGCGTTASSSLPTGSGASSQASSATTAATSEPTPSSSGTAAATLSPTGLGGLKLGMSKSAARETGAVSHVTGSRGTCGQNNSDGWLKAAGKPSEDDSAGILAFSSSSNKLVAIFAYPGVTAEEGIGLGSSQEELQAAYPEWEAITEDNESGGYVKTDSATNSHYIITVAQGKVNGLSLESDDLDCWG